MNKVIVERGIVFTRPTQVPLVDGGILASFRFVSVGLEVQQWYTVVSTDLVAEKVMDIVRRGNHLRLEGRLEETHWSDGEVEYNNLVIHLDSISEDNIVYPRINPDHSCDCQYCMKRYVSV